MKTLYAALGIFLFVLGISIPIILPFFHKGYFPTHDGEWAVVRMAEMFRETRDFQFPARYSGYLNFGYGYPLFNFAYPFPYYLGTGLHLLGFGFVDSVKIIFAITVPLSALFMFLASREFWGSRASGLVSALLYIYLPYRMVDLYVRGSIGESLAFVFFAAIFYILVKIMNNHYSKFLITIGAILYAMLIATHNSMAVLFTVVLGLLLACFLITERKNKKFPLLILFVFGLGLSAFFWMPAIFEKKNILLSVVSIADRSLYYASMEKLILPGWGFGNPTDKDGFSYQIGLPQLTILVLSISLLILSWLKNKSIILNEIKYKHAVILVFILFFSLFLVFPQSDFIWKLPFLSEINYPWIMLAPIGFLISLLSGFLASKTGVLRYALFVLSAISIFLFLPYARSQMYLDRGDQFYMTNDATTTSSKEYTPLWVKNLPNKRPENKVEIIRGDGKISDLVYNSNKLSFNIAAQNDAVARVNTIYYPGWKLYIDGKQAKIDYKNDNGVMDVSLTKENHQVNLIFSETPFRIFADTISVISLIGLPLFLKFYKFSTA